MKRILIVQAGSTEPALRARFGDFPAWFSRHLAGVADLAVARADESTLPAVEGLEGVLVTGSPKSVTAPEPWMEPLAAWLLDAARRIPVLGVCFGHQLLAAALGGRVERNPRGREAGTTEVRLTDAGRADPLFSGMPARFAAQQTHEDHVSRLPEGAVLLAGNAHSPVQAFAHGRNIRCVQFHPEMDAARSRALAAVRRELLDRTSPGGFAAVLGSIRETPDAARILRHWAAGLGVHGEGRARP